MIIAVFERNLSNCEQKPEKVRTSTDFTLKKLFYLDEAFNKIVAFLKKKDKLNCRYNVAFCNAISPPLLLSLSFTSNQISNHSLTQRCCNASLTHLIGW